MQAIACDANASLSSTTSTSPAPIPARSSALRDAPTGPSPMTSGAQPDTAMLFTRASGSIPCSLAYASLHTTTAAAPSVRGEEVPAVTVPSAMNAGFRSASPSRLVSSRMQPSRPMRAPPVSTGTISSSSRPPARAAAARRWLSSANASCSSRVIR